MASAETSSKAVFARAATAPATARPRAAHPLYAALDLGTNNCRLLIARGHDLQVVGSFSRVVRLGEGLARTGELGEAAIERTLDAMSQCARRIVKAEATRVRCVATEACRQARNGAAFVQRVRCETGIFLEPISVREEAELTLSGCRGLIDPARAFVLLFDIGGGSTEVIWASNGAGGPVIQGVISLPMGVVTLAERYGGGNLSDAAYQAIIADVLSALDPFDAAYGIAAEVASGAVQMIGTSGTVTTLGAFALGLARYERARVDGLEIPIGELLSANAFLKGMGGNARAAHACIGPDRADLVLSGCAVLEAVCRLWPAARLCVGDRGIREGLLYAMAAAEHPAASAP